MPHPRGRSGVRPFGVSLLVAGYDDAGPQLYQAREPGETLFAFFGLTHVACCQVDPSGSYFAWKASAIGKNMVNAKTFLEKRYSVRAAGAASLRCA